MGLPDGSLSRSARLATGAREFVAQVSQKIVLINGQRLAELMIEYGVGVSTRETYVLKRADEDYFAEA